MRERGSEKPPPAHAGRGVGDSGGGRGEGGGGWDPSYRNQAGPDHRPGPHSSDFPTPVPEQVVMKGL